MKLTVHEREAMLDYAESWIELLWHYVGARDGQKADWHDNEVALINEFIAMIESAQLEDSRNAE